MSCKSRVLKGHTTRGLGNKFIELDSTASSLSSETRGNRNNRPPQEGGLGNVLAFWHWAYDWPIHATSLQISFHDVTYDRPVINQSHLCNYCTTSFLFVCDALFRFILFETFFPFINLFFSFSTHNCPLFTWCSLKEPLLLKPPACTWISLH